MQIFIPYDLNHASFIAVDYFVDLWYYASVNIRSLLVRYLDDQKCDVNLLVRLLRVEYILWNILVTSDRIPNFMNDKEFKLVVTFICLVEFVALLEPGQVVVQTHGCPVIWVEYEFECGVEVLHSELISRHTE